MLLLGPLSWSQSLTKIIVSMVLCQSILSLSPGTTRTVNVFACRGDGGDTCSQCIALSTSFETCYWCDTWCDTVGFNNPYRSCPIGSPQITNSSKCPFNPVVNITHPSDGEVFQIGQPMNIEFEFHNYSVITIPIQIFVIQGSANDPSKPDNWLPVNDYTPFLESPWWINITNVTNIYPWYFTWGLRGANYWFEIYDWRSPITLLGRSTGYVSLTLDGLCPPTECSTCTEYGHDCVWHEPTNICLPTLATRYLPQPEFTSPSQCLTMTTSTSTYASGDIITFHLNVADVNLTNITIQLCTNQIPTNNCTSANSIYSIMSVNTSLILPSHSSTYSWLIPNSISSGQYFVAISGTPGLSGNTSTTTPSTYLQASSPIFTITQILPLVSSTAAAASTLDDQRSDTSSFSTTVIIFVVLAISGIVGGVVCIGLVKYCRDRSKHIRADDNVSPLAVHRVNHHAAQSIQLIHMSSIQQHHPSSRSNPEVNDIHPVQFHSLASAAASPSSPRIHPIQNDLIQHPSHVPSEFINSGVEGIVIASTSTSQSNGDHPLRIQPPDYHLRPIPSQDSRSLIQVGSFTILDQPPPSYDEVMKGDTI